MKLEKWKEVREKKDFQKVKKRKSESFLEFSPEGKLEKFSLEKAQPKTNPKFPIFAHQTSFATLRVFSESLLDFLPVGKLEKCISEKGLAMLKMSENYLKILEVGKKCQTITWPKCKNVRICFEINALLIQENDNLDGFYFRLGWIPRKGHILEMYPKQFFSSNLGLENSMVMLVWR